MNKWVVTKHVHVREFDTNVLMKEIYNRIDDYMNDPEPQYDPFLEQLAPCERLQLKEELRKHV